MLADLRYAFRAFRRAPAFSAIAVLILALAIGANSAMFSVVNAVLLRSLPYEKPDQIAILWMRFTGIGLPNDENAVSAPELMDLRKHSKAFDAISAIDQTSFNVHIGTKPERLPGAFVSPAFFAVLGVAPQLGRLFRTDEDTPGRSGVAVISSALWHSRFQSSPNVTSQSIQVNGRMLQIVGVMPPGFQFPPDAEIWAPLAFSADDLTPGNRGNHGLIVIARVTDGLSVEAAKSDMQRVSQLIVQGAPQYPYKDFGFRIILKPLLTELVGDIRPALLLLMGSVGFVLLIACSNVANLLLARASARQREIAIRTALGAGRWDLVRQLLTESTLLALGGAVIGLVLAKLGLAGFTGLAAQSFPRIAEAGLDWQVFAFTLMLACGTGVLFGLWPAFQTIRGATHESLKDGSRGLSTSVGRNRLRGAFVIAEVTLSLVLLVGAGLLIRSFLRLQQVDPGFRPERVFTARAALPDLTYPDPQKISAFYRQLSERLAHLPGVESSGLISALPLSGQGGSGTTTIDTQAVPRSQRSPEADRRVITPGALETLGVALIRGRYFSNSDIDKSEPVAIVDETMAKTFFPNEDPIGRRVKIGGPDSPGPWMKIVGVVRHVRYRTLESPSRVQLYMPHGQSPYSSMSIAIRSGLNPSMLSRLVEQEVQAIDPNQPVYGVKTMQELMAASMARRRLSMLLLAIFSAIALVLAAAGIYGVISYTVSQQTKEIGIRMALGAGHSRVLGHVMGRNLLLIFSGIGLGVAGSLLLTRFLSNLLFEIGAHDPLTLVCVAGLLAAVGALAGYVPARRATLVDPVHALRQE